MQEKQVNQTKTRNNSKAMLHFIAIVLTVVTIVSLAIGLFAWSKYTASINGNANAAVAKWNFNLSLKSGSTTVTANQTLNLATTQYETSSHIANGKIAPGTSGEFDIVIDTRGTEVSMLYDVTIGMTNCPRNITFSKKGPGENSFTVISPMQTGDTNERTRTLNFSKYLTLNDVTTANTNDTTFVETIKWEWPYELTSGTDDEKTAYDNRDKADSGITATLNITATGSEVMNAPLSEAIVTYGDNKTVTNGGTITLKTNDEPITLRLTSGSEAVTFNSSNTSVATVASSEAVQNGVVVTPVGVGSTVITLTGQETGKQIIINVTIETPGTPVSEITSSQYGQYVNLGTSILPKENGTITATLSSGGTNGGEILADWRVFYKDNDGGVWLILADYMPNSAFNVANAGLDVGTGSYTTYGVRSATSRVTLINGLKGEIANTSWNALLTGSSLLNGTTLATGVKVQGAVDLETWVESWNEKHSSDKIYLGKTESNMTDGLKGYYISKTNNPPTTSEYSVSKSTSDRLFYPHTDQPGSNYGYWLASPSAIIASHVMYVGSGGDVTYDRYNYSYYGVRPAVYLPATVKLNTSGTVWTIAE